MIVFLKKEKTAVRLYAQRKSAHLEVALLMTMEKKVS